MRIDCTLISDLHGEEPVLDGGDMIIIAGDLTGRNDNAGWTNFELWLMDQPYDYKIIIAGNHDGKLEDGSWNLALGMGSHYLCDSGVNIHGRKIWGSPWTAAFKGMNPHCKAFTIDAGCDTEEYLKEKWDLIPDDTDILITHCPPYGIMDEVKRRDGKIERTGSLSLLNRIDQIKPKLHVFGHIHGAYGKCIYKRTNGINTIMVNASQLDEDYIMTNKPIRVKI